MSAVYEATHRNGKRVAIKVLRVDLQANERTRGRFMREGYIANQVVHDGVVAVLDDEVTEDGAVFLVMELLEGMNVEQYASACGGRIPQGEILAIADAVLDILVAAHAKRIIHRDIKPSNLFLTSGGKLKLLDFGIASFRESSGLSHTTGEGVLLGTPGFMAPEQACGRWKSVDARTDLWAIGALMFRLLTGRLVYEAESPNEYIVAAATERVPLLASIDPSLPAAIADIVDRALKGDPADRFQTAGEMQTAVRAQMARFAHCRIPAPLRIDPGTLDESISTNVPNELPDRTLSGWPFGPMLPTLRDMRALLPYGAIGLSLALGFLYLSGGVREGSTSAGDVRPPAKDTPSSELVPLISSAVVAGLALPSLAVSSRPDIPAPAAAGSVAAPVRREPAPVSSAPRTTGRRIAQPEALHATPPVHSASPHPPRLEDVLDERR